MNDVGRILDNLKTCPFCGGIAGRRFCAESLELPFECIITCADCGASLKVIDTANDLKTTQNLAIDKWNTRIDDALELPKAQEAIKPTINEYGEAYCICGENVGIIPDNKNLPSVRSDYCSRCGRRMKWE